jgi:hypothetical protein
MENQTPPARAGRPPVVIYNNEIERLAGLGLTAAQIADRVGVSRRTLFSKLEQDPQLREALDRGVSAAVEAAATILRDQMFDGNTTALIVFLKTKGGFTLPKDSVASPPPQPTSEAASAAILDRVDAMASRQRALLARDRQGASDAAD